MLNSLIKYEQIITTLPKAKELKPQIDKVITIGKKNILSNKKRLFSKLQNKKSESIQFSVKTKKYLPLSVRQERPKAIAWLIREYGKILTDTQIAKLTSSTKPTVANIRAGNQSQPITEFRNPTDLGLCTYEDLEILVEKGQRKAEREKKPQERAEKLQSTTV